GEEMGMKVETVQNTWEGLVEGLKRKDYDMIVNGLEITPDRAKVVRFTRPYYITAQMITVRRENETVKKLEDLKGLKVATLISSLAQRILEAQTFPMNIFVYNAEIHAYNDLAM